MQDEKGNTICPNCEKNRGLGKFCQNCGQKNTPLKLNIKTIFGEFFSIVFNLDNQFFRTIRAAFVPGKLAESFVKGKRKLYLHPLRFFFYTWLLLALIMNIDFGNNTSISDGVKEGWNMYDSDSKPVSDSLESKSDDNFKINFGDRNYCFTSDTSKFQSSQDTTFILYQDIDSLSEKQLLQKYNMSSWMEKLVIKRAKQFKTGSYLDILQFLKDHMIWLFLFVIPFSALSLSVLFWRSKKYYSEHILYLMYLFSVLFIIISIFLLVGQISYKNSIVLIVLLLLFLYYIYYSFRSMKNFYKRGTMMTLWKWNIYLIGNWFLFLLGSIVYVLLSLILF